MSRVHELLKSCLICHVKHCMDVAYHIYLLYTATARSLLSRTKLSSVSINVEIHQLVKCNEIIKIYIAQLSEASFRVCTILCMYYTSKCLCLYKFLTRQSFLLQGCHMEEDIHWVYYSSQYIHSVHFKWIYKQYMENLIFTWNIFLRQN